ncbi:NADPH:quinone reductase [Thalassoglobus sp.]|uniref:NADPH:quinone reductase n=1 Tax=Thalassoglobus sp. TaxID=2795869 RepID=UPI003AA838D5
MLAAFIEKQGDPQVFQIGEQPTPVPADGEVLVRIAASAVNPIDTYIRSGAIPLPIEFPYIPGCDLAGTVEAVGPGTTRFQVGDRVWGSNQSLFGRQGTLAEYAAVHEDWLYATPAKMTDEQAAAGALTGITAHLGLFLHGQLQQDEIVFINGGTGGVGSMVVQFAKAYGARVITTAGSPEKRELAKSLGADLVLDYRSDSLDEEIQAYCESNGGIDLWWETQRQPTLPRTIGMMKKRGRIILMAGRDAEPQFPLGQFYVNDLRLLGFAMFNATPEEQLACAIDMNQWFENGQWKPLIGQTLTLQEAQKAHEIQEANTLGGASSLVGKIIVTT